MRISDWSQTCALPIFCSAQVNEPVTGTWKTEDNKLCVDIAWAGKSQITGCYTMFFVMDSVAMVKPDGTVSGKAHALKKGAAPDMYGPVVADLPPRSPAWRPAAQAGRHHGPTPSHRRPQRPRQ